MEFAWLSGAAETLGPAGLWFVIGFGVFRYLVKRNDQQAKANLEELRRQLVSWRRRALRAELLVRAYNVEGYPLPTAQVQREVLLQRELEGIDVWPEYGVDGSLRDGMEEL